MAHLIVGSNEVAEEIVQDAFVAVYPRYGSVQTLTLPAPHGGERLPGLDPSQADRWPAARADAAGPAPELDETWAALDRLSPSQRTTVVLRFYGDLSLAEIAELTGSRLGTVKSQLHRALAQLKDVLAP